VVGGDEKDGDEKGGEENDGAGTDVEGAAEGDAEAAGSVAEDVV